VGYLITGLLAGNVWFLRNVISKAMKAYEEVQVMHSTISDIHTSLSDITKKVDRLLEIKADITLLKYRVFGRHPRSNGEDEYSHHLDDADPDTDPL
jgi:hypothetical protein